MEHSLRGHIENMKKHAKTFRGERAADSGPGGAVTRGPHRKNSQGGRHGLRIWDLIVHLLGVHVEGKFGGPRATDSGPDGTLTGPGSNGKHWEATDREAADPGHGFGT